GRAAHQGGRGYVWEYFPGMEIYEYTFATGELKNLTKSDKYDAEASYSPDGKLIMFSSLREGAQQVFIANADGSNPRRISNGPGDGGPFFSPDGKRVIYRGDRKGDGNMQIFVNNLEGTAEKAITPADALYWCPYWHPSGKWVAFTYSDLKQMPPRFDVYVMRDDGSDMQRVTSAGAWNGLPVFSPDGKYLMWTSKRGNADTPQIFIADFVGLTPEGDVKR
ncbi:MAG: biopolymer transporter Tol, partial [Planctomycetota bacterium]